MTAGMLGGATRTVGGIVSSGGTESILLAMKAYRDRAGIERPQMVVPATAHAAFDKAAHYFGIETVHVPVGPDWRADVAATADAITDRTIVVVGSAPCFPHGAIDPIEELAALAARAASASTPTPASAASCCRGPSGSATPCRRSTSACPA